jgi:hypothetical protein
MTTFESGTAVKNGYYVDTAGFTVATIANDGDRLPGKAGARWLRVPVLAVMAAAPVIGGLFVVALPFIGFGLGAWAIGRAVGAKVKGGAAEIAATVAAPLATGSAHLTGAPGAKDAPAAGAKADEKVEALAKEIAEKREGEKKA